jgi:hypothetical protein
MRGFASGAMDGRTLHDTVVMRRGECLVDIEYPRQPAPQAAECRNVEGESLGQPLRYMRGVVQTDRKMQALQD